MRTSLIGFSIVVLTNFNIGTTVSAEGLARFVAGGQSAKLITEGRAAEFEKVTGLQVEVKIAPLESALKSLEKDLIDGVVSGLPENVSKVLEKAGKPKLSEDQFKWVHIANSVTSMGVNPENPVKTLTHEQIAGILSGKITNWKPISGIDVPITVYFGKNYQELNQSVNSFFIQQNDSPVTHWVVDKSGMFKAFKSDKGAFGPVTDRDPIEGFAPKAFASDLVRPIYLYMKKESRPEIDKLYKHLQTAPKSRFE